MGPNTYMDTYIAIYRLVSRLASYYTKQGFSEFQTKQIFTI